MTTYYVDGDTGDNGNGGESSGDAWETITYAVTQISGGDVIRVIKTAGAYTDTFTVTANYSANPVTITGDDDGDPPVITTATPWVFSGADGWVIQDFIFTGWSQYYGPIRLGDTQCTAITIQDCWFRYATGHGISVTGSGVNGLTIQRCKFRDIRSRSGIINRNAISVWGNAADVDVKWCIFEDLGSDGVHIHSGTTITDFVIEDCGFFVNRPYSTSGTSLYNGDTTTWQDYNDNCAEEGNDIWQVAVSNGESVTVRRCAFYGFYPVEAAQDASQNHYGYGFIAQYDTDAYYCHDSLFYDNHFGAIFSYGSGTWAAGTLDGCFIHNSDDDGLWSHGGNAAHDLTVTDNCIVDSVLSPMNFRYTKVADCSGNICGGDPNDRGGNTGSANVDYNLWISGTPSDAFFQGGNDYSDHTLNISDLDGTSGKLVIVNDINTITLPPVALWLHPSLSALEDDLDTVLRGWTPTLAEQAAPDGNGAGGRYSLALT